MKSGDTFRVSGDEILAQAVNRPDINGRTIVIWHAPTNTFVVASHRHTYEATAIRLFPVNGGQLSRIVYRAALESMARVATEDVYYTDSPHPP